MSIIALFLVSCVDDDDDCLDDQLNARIEFNYRGNGDTNVLERYITSGYLFIYNADKKYVKSMFLSLEEVLKGVDLALPGTGKYYLMSWANVGEYTELLNKTKLETLKLTHKHDLTVTSDRVYYGLTEIELTDNDVSTNRIVKRTMHYKSGHINVEVNIHNATELKPIIHFKNVLNDLNYQGHHLQTLTSYTIRTKNEIVDGQAVKRAEFSTLRFTKSNSILVEVLNEENGENILSENLMGLLDEEDLSKLEKEEVTLILNLNMNGDVIELSLEVWEDSEIILGA